MTFPFMPFMQVGVAGETWQPITSSIIATTNDLRYNAVNPVTGTWIVTSSDKKVFTTTDNGQTWAMTQRTDSELYQLEGAAYGAGHFVITNDSGNKIWASVDGVNWTKRDDNSTDNHTVTYNDGYFIVGSGDAGGSGKINASTDGLSWTYGAQGVVGGNSVRTGIYVAALGRTFVAGAQRKYANSNPKTGTSWSGDPTGIGGDARAVVWSPTLSLAILCTDNGLYSSSNLMSWTSRSSVGVMYGVAWCTNQFVAVGGSGRILTSPDGLTWISRTSGTTSSLFGVSELNGTILVTGSGGTILRSG